MTGHSHIGSFDSIISGSESIESILCFSPHSQTVRTLQPDSIRSFICRLSRSVFRLSFSCQNSLRVAGEVA